MVLVKMCVVIAGKPPMMLSTMYDIILGFDCLLCVQ